MGNVLKVAINSSLKSLTTQNERRNWCERAGNMRRFKVYLLHVVQQREEIQLLSYPWNFSVGFNSVMP